MKLLTTLSALLISGTLSASPLHHIVVFGDSLSDNGNLYQRMNHTLPPSPPYFEGRFSNGPVWVEQLAAGYFADPVNGLQDYAIGGAGISEDEGSDALFTLQQEIDSYLADHQGKFNPDDLYVVWIGANNYLGMPEDFEGALKEVNTGITKGLKKLADLGATNVLVINLPDLGSTPVAIEFDSVAAFSYLTAQHNQALNQSLVQLKQSYPQVNWLMFDANQLFTDVISNPAEFGVTNVTGGCYNPLVDDITRKSVLKMVAGVKATANQDPCDGYLFFDLIHPTVAAQKVIADKVRITLETAGVTFTD